MKSQTMLNLLCAAAISVSVCMMTSCESGNDVRDNSKDSLNTKSQAAVMPVQEKYFFDVHHIGKGKVTYAGVAGAHAKDLATQGKFGVHFLKYWVDEKAGNVYCLASAKDSLSIHDSHSEAHGLIPDRIFEVAGGPEGVLKGGKNYFLDIHELGPGKVTPGDVAEAHRKDLAVQDRHGVNFVNYWLDEKDGRVVCLSEANVPADIISAHKEAHGLIPVSVIKVKQGGE